MANFTSGTTFTATKAALTWLPSGDFQIDVSVTVAGVERVRRPFIVKADGSAVLDRNGVNIGTPPPGFVAALATLATKIDTLVDAAATSGKVDV